MSDCMTFPDTVEEFMEQYKIVDTDGIYMSKGAELVPIFRMRQWFEHLPSAQPERYVKIPETGIDDLSDGFHTFRQLYYQRMMLFATIVKQNRDMAWKSLRHEDGELCFGGGWFIVGIDTPEGSYTYHYEDNYFGLFDCKELERGKHWDGHTEKDVTRLLSLPSAQPGLCEDAVSRQAVIDALEQKCVDICPYSVKQRKVMCGVCMLESAFDVVENLPSAQPERDIPKKPNETIDKSWGISLKQPVCPNCDYYIGLIYFRGGGRKRITYCETCGQAIDWEGWENDG